MINYFKGGNVLFSEFCFYLSVLLNKNLSVETNFTQFSFDPTHVSPGTGAP